MDPAEKRPSRRASRPKNPLPTVGEIQAEVYASQRRQASLYLLGAGALVAYSIWRIVLGELAIGVLFLMVGGAGIVLASTWLSRMRTRSLRRI